MTGAYVLTDEDWNEIAGADDLAAARAAARYLLTSGEEAGPIQIWKFDADFPLETAALNEHGGVVWQGTTLNKGR